MLERVLTAFGGNEETGAAKVRAMPATTPEQPVLVSTMKCHKARGRASSHVADAVICIQTTWWACVFPAMMCGQDSVQPCL